MRLPAQGDDRTTEFRRALSRLESLPIRPLSAMAVIDAPGQPPGDADDPRLPKFLASDPGWRIRPSGDDRPSALALVADRRWWRAPTPESAEALERLWKHAVATSGMARKLAVEAGRKDLDEIARAGLLQQLGLWAIGAVDPPRLAILLEVADRSRRAGLERGWIGRDAASLGRDLAERWGCGPLVAASAWLHADSESGLGRLADDPGALAILQEAYSWAERTPWALFPSSVPDPGPTDARLRILIAEVQVRCGAGLIDPPASEREEAITRSHARLQLDRDRLASELATCDRLLSALAEGSPADEAEAWADRASRAFCEEPGVASARVCWGDRPEGASARPASRIVRMGRSGAEVHLWLDPDDEGGEARIARVMPAWSAWAEGIARRDRAGSRLESVVDAHRELVERTAEAERTTRLEALAEFAGGAGHELNNPLAVILGRAQLLLPKVTEPDATRSLRVIIGQAQRAHRILRDMMYVARPPMPRPRPCRPDDIVKASIRDLKAEAEARGVRLVAEVREPILAGWADPEPMRHLLDVLIRNALEASPKGSTVRVTSGKAGDRLHWVVRDGGRGIADDEGAHLFEPFYCGRQAGRGLGLGLPRAARFLRLAGGDLAWKSSPGHGSSFAITLPIEPSPGRGEVA